MYKYLPYTGVLLLVLAVIGGGYDVYRHSPEAEALQKTSIADDLKESGSFVDRALKSYLHGYKAESIDDSDLAEGDDVQHLLGAYRVDTASCTIEPLKQDVTLTPGVYQYSSHLHQYLLVEWPTAKKIERLPDCDNNGFYFVFTPKLMSFDKDGNRIFVKAQGEQQRNNFVEMRKMGVRSE